MAHLHRQSHSQSSWDLCGCFHAAQLRRRPPNFVIAVLIVRWHEFLEFVEQWLRRMTVRGAQPEKPLAIQLCTAIFVDSFRSKANLSKLIIYVRCCLPLPVSLNNEILYSWMKYWSHVCQFCSDVFSFIVELTWIYIASIFSRPATRRTHEDKSEDIYVCWGISWIQASNIDFKRGPILVGLGSD